MSVTDHNSMHESVKELLNTHEEAQLSVESKTEIEQRLDKADASEKAEKTIRRRRRRRTAQSKGMQVVA